MSTLYEQSLVDLDKTLRLAKTNLYFKHGKVEQFNYQDKGWIGRKITALPLGAFAVIRGIFHGCLAFTSAVSKKKFRAKALACHSIRDFQEAYGRIYGIVNDKLGLYHIQESQFQKKCYSNCKEVMFKHSLCKTTYNGIFVEKHLVDTSLYEYLHMKEEEKETYGSVVSEAALQYPNLLERVNESFLKELKLAEFAIPEKNRILKFAHMTDEEFQSLSMSNFYEEENRVSYDQVKFIRSRVSSTLISPKVLSFESILDVPLVDLRYVQLNKLENLPEIHPGSFYYFTDEQLSSIQVQQLTEQQFKCACRFLSSEEKMARIGLFEIADIFAAMEKEIITDRSMIKPMIDDLIDLLKSDSSKKVIALLFHAYDNEDDRKDRFARIPSDIVNEYVKNNKLDRNHFHLFSDEQIKGLNAEILTMTNLNIVFECYDKDKKRKFSLLSSATVNTLIGEGKLDRIRLGLLSDEQIQSLQVEYLTKEVLGQIFGCYHRERKRKFSLLSSATVNTLIGEGKLDRIRLGLLSDEQIKGLQAEVMTEKVVKDFFNPYCTEENKRKFALLSDEVVKHLVENNQLPKSLMKLIPPGESTLIDYSKMSEKEIQALFPPFSFEAVKRANSSFLAYSSKKDGKTLDQFKGYKCHFSDEEIVKIAEKRKFENQEKFKQLSSEQLNTIYDKVSPENQKLIDEIKGPKIEVIE